MTPEEEIVRAGQAAELLDLPIMKEAIRHIEQGLAAQRRKVPMMESEMHSRLILTEQLWNNLLAYIGQVVETGKMAQFQVEARKKRLFPFPR